MNRDSIPAAVKRAVLVEAGHRCAIPTCRATTTEIAHILAWSDTHDNSFENLIALCPNCHTRYDQKKEIDHGSMKMYKQNLGILTNRYSEFELRLFEILSQTEDRIFVLGMGGDVMVFNAVKDGIFQDLKVNGGNFIVSSDSGYERALPSVFTYKLTEAGVSFIHRYVAGKSIAYVEIEN